MDRQLQPLTPELIHAMRGALRVSKHRQLDRDGKWIEGKVRIGSQSGLRKLMRAARRGKVPLERVRDIGLAQESAAKAKRHKWERDAESAAKALAAGILAHGAA
jgi:hypothetical protein